MSNPKPLPIPEEYRAKFKWKSGKTRAVRIPESFCDDHLAIAHCIDRNPAIAAQVLAFAQSLLAE